MRTFDVAGVSATDPYFRDHLRDGFEPEFQRLCEDLVRYDYVCADVGAHIGMKLMLSQYAPQGSELAIEGAPTACSVLQRNAAASGLQDITVVNASVGDREGTVRFTDHSAWGHISEQGVELGCQHARIGELLEWVRPGKSFHNSRNEKPRKSLKPCHRQQPPPPNRAVPLSRSPTAEVVLRHRPLERHPLVRPFLPRRAIRRHIHQDLEGCMGREKLALPVGQDRSSQRQIGPPGDPPSEVTRSYGKRQG